MVRQFFILTVLVVAGLWTDATEAASIVQADRETVKTSTTNNKSRQLLNSDVPTAAAGLGGGSTSANPLQSLALMQQLQATTGGNPLGLAAELAAQNKESAQIQNQNQQQSLLAAVQLQQQHVAAAQAALSQQNMVNGTPSLINGIGSTSTNVQTQRLQQQLELKKQQLLAQQALLQEQVKPESQQPSQQQILLAQLIRNPGANQAQLLEQIRQQQVKQQAEAVTQQQFYQQQQQPASSLMAQQMLQPSSLIQQVRLAGLLGGSSRLGLSSSSPDLQVLLLMQQIMLRQQLANMAMTSSYLY